MAFTPKQRTQIYAEMTAQVLANAPITSSELGEVVDNILFANADQDYELYVQQVNALALLKLDNTTGDELDSIGSEYPDLPARFSATRGTGTVRVTDPSITKISSLIDLGGANSGDTTLAIQDASSMPSAGTVLIGTRGDVNFESVAYSSKSGNILNLSAALVYDHAYEELVVLSTVGDRVYSSTYSAKTIATSTSLSKVYTSTSSLTIYDGEEFGYMSIQADSEGPNGNTSSNTIVEWVGTPPFLGALVSNDSAIENGQSRESDANYRSRIRQQRQALSSGNIDAITSAVFNANYNGQQVKFVQQVEDPDPTLPTLIYFDDGSGFVPSETEYTTAITLVDVAFGGEKRFEIPSARRPIVTTEAENVTRIFSNIELKLNGSLISQGDSAGQYRVQPDRGFIRLNTPLSAGDKLEITKIRYYTGLAQEVNYRIYGKREDRVNYPGASSAGAWIQGRVPSIQFVSIQGNVTLDGTRTIDEVVAEIKSAMLQYINNLGIGQTVVRNRLISLGFVKGVKDFTLLLPVSDVIIPDATMAKSSVGNITLS